MSLKNREYSLSTEEKLLLRQLRGLVKPLRKKPVEPSVVKLKPMDITIEAPIAKSIPAKKPLAVGNTGGLNKTKQRKMDQGQLPIDLCIDLHGMRTDQAFITFEGAIDQAYTQQLRLILVITGKGKNSPTPSGVLKNELPRWLNLATISGKIIRASQASAQHGGSGAFYILIKRIRP